MPLKPLPLSILSLSSIVTASTAPIQHIQTAPQAATALHVTFYTGHTASPAPVQHTQIASQAATALTCAFSSVVTAATAQFSTSGLLLLPPRHLIPSRCLV
ncbi:hypothetical protein KCU78_g2990, partial [Aureobasidium melanogenum]